MPNDNDILIEIEELSPDIAVVENDGIELSIRDVGGDYVEVIERGGASSGGGGGGTLRPETPAGTINGSNAVFTLSVAPDPPENLMLFRNGIAQSAGADNDFTLDGLTITFVGGVVPMTGDSLLAFMVR